MTFISLVPSIYTNVKQYGALGDGKTVTDGAITTGTPTLTSASAAFTAADVGKLITVNGAGAAGANLNTTISAYVNATTVTLAANAGTTVSAATVFYATDDTTAIAAALAAVATNGGSVIFPAGTYLSGNQTLAAKVHLRGAGKEATVIKLKNGANTDLFSAQTSLINVAALGGVGPAGTLYNFGIYDMTLDGNRANQTAGPSYPLRFYGYSYIFQNLIVRNGYSGNVLSDYNAPFSDATPNFVTDGMESAWVNIKTYGSGGIGVQFAGPHDMVFINCDFFEEAQHCLHLGPNAGGCQFTNLHTWYPGFGTIVAPTLYGSDYLSTRATGAGIGTATDGQAYTALSSLLTQTASITLGFGAAFTVSGSETVWRLGSTSAANIDAYMTLNKTDYNSASGIAWHIQSVGNYYSAIVYQNTFQIRKLVAGGVTTLATTTYYRATNVNLKIHVQQVGTSLKAKVWEDGFPEPSAWTLTVTDSVYASGTFGMYQYVNTGNNIASFFQVTTVPAYSNCLAILCEAQVCHFTNCQAEDSDTVQVAFLQGGCTWMGGDMFSLPVPKYYYSSAFQIGQNAGLTPFPGQAYQSAGVTTSVGAFDYYIYAKIHNTAGPNGAINFAHDNGHGVVDAIVRFNSDEGAPYGGIGPHSTTKLNLVATNLSGYGQDGGITIKSNLTSYTVLDPGNSGQIPTYGLDVSRVSPAANRTAVVLQAGAVQGQAISVMNTSASFSITFDASNVSNVADGSADVVAPLTSRDFRWDSGTGLWYPTDLQSLPVQSATAAATATAGTIATAGVDVARVAPTANITGVILGVGTVAGQVVKVVNESAFSITFAASGTSHVATGVLCQIAPTVSALFVYDSVTALWYQDNIPPLPVQSATAVAIAANGAIATAGLDVSRLAPTAARTGITMQAGTYAGQKCFVINESAFVLTYNATPATSLIANSAVVTTLPVTSGRLFCWDSATALWY